MGRVADAVRRDLDELDAQQPGIGASALALAAVVLAEQMDGRKVSATAKSMCAARLLETLATLRESVPPKVEKDRIDEVGRKRAARKRRASS